MTKRVIIDDREALTHPMWAETDVLLTDTQGTFLKEGYMPEVDRLPSGDLRLETEEDGDWVVLELKTVPDWISTLRDKGEGRTQSRLRHQVAGLLGIQKMGQIPGLMLIGNYRPDGRKIKFGDGRKSRSYSASWAEIETSLVALQSMGIIVGRCPTLEEVPHAAGLLATSIGRREHFGDPGLARVGLLSPRLDRLATVFSSVPGLGPGRCRDLAERFGTFPAFFAASVDDLVESEGIGKVLATWIYDQFHSEVAPAPNDPFDPEFSPFE